MARKLALVPIDMLTRMQVSAQTDGTLAQLGQMNKNIESSLQTTHLPSDVQAKLFDQMFHQFQAFRDAQMHNDTSRHNMKIPIIDDGHAPLPAPPPVAALEPGAPPRRRRPVGTQDSDFSTARDDIEQSSVTSSSVASSVASQQQPGTSRSRPAYNTDDNIVKGLPPGKKPMARKLLAHVRNNRDISWDTLTGLVSIDGHIVHGSNITTIIDDLSRDYKTRPPAVGAIEFGVSMNKTVMPRSYIGNIKRRDDIANTAVSHHSPLARQVIRHQYDDLPAAAAHTPKRPRKTPKKKSNQSGSGLHVARWESVYK